MGVDTYDTIQAFLKLENGCCWTVENSWIYPNGFGIEPISDFVRCLINDLPFIADARDGLEAEKIAEAVHKSVETGCKVMIKKEEVF